MQRNPKDIKSLATAKKLYPELVQAVQRLCLDIYNDIAMDGFGINGARSKAEYISVMSDHVYWETNSIHGGNYSISNEAKMFYTQRCTYRTQKQIIGSSFQG
jgi:hypothetical protein